MELRANWPSLVPATEARGQRVTTKQYQELAQDEKPVNVQDQEAAKENPVVYFIKSIGLVFGLILAVICVSILVIIAIAWAGASKTS
jgi:hypothetical protein